MRKDPTEFRKRFAAWKAGEKVYEGGLPLYQDGKEDAYQTFVNSLPKNQRVPGAYNTRRYWELNDKPKDFAEAIGKGMYAIQEDDGVLGWHANSVAYNENNSNYEFMKPNYHPTRWMELVYGYNQSPEFLKDYKVLYNGPMLSDRYVRREKPGFKVKGGQLPKFRTGLEGIDFEDLIKRRLESKSDATTVQRQEPVQPIERLYGKVVDPKLVERKLQQLPVIKKGNTYKVKPRPLTFAGRVTQAVGGDWIKADMTSAAVSLIPVIGQLNGSLDFGYDLNNSTHNILDVEANANTVMSGLALLPYARNGLKMLKGKTYIDRLRNAYDQLITKYNTSREINKALKTARTSDAIYDGTSNVFDEYAKEWFNNEVSFIRPFRSSGGKGNTVGDVIDYNLGLFGGRDKPLSELTDNQRYRIATMLSKDERFPKGTRVIHMDDSGPLPVNNVGFVPKDASNSNSVWNSSLNGLAEIWWNRGTPYYNAKGYPSIQNIPRTIISDIEDLKRYGITLEGRDVMHGSGVVPFQSVQYGIQPNLFGWFDRIKFVGQ